MRASICIFVLFVLVAGCKRYTEPAATSDERMQKRLAGIWVHEVKSPSGKEIKGIDTVKMAPDGTYTSIVSLPMRKVGARRIESSGIWRIEDGIIIITETSVSATNFQGTNVMRFKIVRFEDHELELEFGGEVDGFSIPTNRSIFRKEAR